MHLSFKIDSLRYTIATVPLSTFLKLIINIRKLSHKFIQIFYKNVTNFVQNSVNLIIFVEIFLKISSNSFKNFLKIFSSEFFLLSLKFLEISFKLSGIPPTS